MTYVPNPFRVRYAEQQRDRNQFLNTFGAGMLALVPPADAAWDRVIVLQSAPGAGKTSLMRMFTPASLMRVAQSPDDFPHLAAPLAGLGAVAGGRPAVLGVMVSLGKDYKALVDLGPGGSGSDKAFFRLLDARILAKVVEATLTVSGLRFPADAARVSFSPLPGVAGQQAVMAAERLLADPPEGKQRDRAAPVDGASLLAAAREHEQDVLRLLDSLLPVEWSVARGHSRLYSLPFLSGARASVDGRPVAGRPAILLDDVHDLADGQRRALYAQLMDRSLDIGRWVAERYSAMRDEEQLTDSSPEGRDVTTIRLEVALGGRSKATERLFADIADNRASRGPTLAGQDGETFTGLLRHRGDVDTDVAQAALGHCRNRVAELVDEHPRFRGWASEAADAVRGEPPLRAAVRWREAQLLIDRFLLRPQPSLFDEEPADPDGPGYEAASGSGTRRAARLFLAREHNVPYYGGSDVLAELASRNVEQYLGLAGDLFDLMLAAVTIGRPAALSLAEQDRQARAASKRLWAALPQRVPYGNDVVALLHAIAANSRAVTYRPNAPYAPGVNGTAFAYVDRPRLFPAAAGQHGSSVARLGRALSSAIAYNMLEVDQPNRAKGGTWTVLYLNRLLCPYFGLPLHRGGFREQSVARLADWLESAAAVRVADGLPDPELPLHGVDRADQ